MVKLGIINFSNKGCNGDLVKEDQGIKAWYGLVFQKIASYMHKLKCGRKWFWKMDSRHKFEMRKYEREHG